MVGHAEDGDAPPAAPLTPVIQSSSESRPRRGRECCVEVSVALHPKYPKPPTDQGGDKEFLQMPILVVPLLLSA